MVRALTYPGQRLRQARFSVSVAFLAFAFAAGSWAPRIPAVKDATGVDDTYLGLALAGLAVGALAGTRMASVPIARIGSARSTRLSLVALCLAVVGPGLVTNFVGLLVTLTLLGVAIGVLDVAVNAQAVVVERGYRRPVMSGLHGLYSVGALLGAATGGLAAELGVPPALHFPLVAAVTVVASLPALRGLLPESEPAGIATVDENGVPTVDENAVPWVEKNTVPTVEENGGDGTRPRATDVPLRSPAVLLLGLIGFASFVGEGAAADWSAVYLRDHLHTGEGFAASAITVFSLAMAGTRLVADRVLARLGPVTVVRAGGLIAAIGFGAALLANHPVAAVIGFGLLGVGLGPIVPTVFSAAGQLGDGSNVTLGRVVTIGYLGSTTGPIQIGLLAALVGLPAALSLLAVFAALIAVLAARVSTASGGDAVRQTPDGSRT